MFEHNGFSRSTNAAVSQAIGLAALWGHTYIGSEHLLLGILKKGEGEAYGFLCRRNLFYDACRKRFLQRTGIGEKTALTPEDFTPCCHRILQRAIFLAGQNNRQKVDPWDLLYAILQEEKCRALSLIREEGNDPAELLRIMGRQEQPRAADGEYVRRIPQKSSKGGSRSVLERYTTDLTQLARLGRLDPLIGREKEMRDLTEILCRRTKNNPCILGEAGVGKTALAEGLAQAIVKGNVPDRLKGCRLLSTDLTAMVAGTKYRGDFEERIRSLMNEVTAQQNIILFIDELHTLVGAGVAEGSVDAANILKPQLARGEVQIIGATTPEEYRKYIEKDAALDRRFQTVTVEEPSEEETVRILQGLCERYEKFHRVVISKEAIQRAVAVAKRYYYRRKLPDSAIDLIDQAAASLWTEHNVKYKSITELERELERLKSQITQAMLQNDRKAAEDLHCRQEELSECLCREKKKQQEKGACAVLTEKHIDELAARQTGIDLGILGKTEREKFLLLEQELDRDVLGQPEAVKAVSRAVCRSRAGLLNRYGPVGSFLFLGPTGVGKTYLCRCLAHKLFGEFDALLRLDMTEYMEGNSLSRLLGAPPGYAGFDQGSHALEKLREKPYCVVLLDEIEKAHPDVLGILLQAMDRGQVTDAAGRTISFRNAVLVMTSNLGYREILKKTELGFGAQQDAPARQRAMEQRVRAELKQFFRPEFLNRIDETVVFHRLTEENCLPITCRMLEELSQSLSEQGITAEFSQETVSALTALGFDEENGARPLARTVAGEVSDVLAMAILRGELGNGDRIFCDWDHGLIVRKTTELLPVPAIS